MPTSSVFPICAKYKVSILSDGVYLCVFVQSTKCWDCQTVCIYGHKLHQLHIYTLCRSKVSSTRRTSLLSDEYQQKIINIINNVNLHHHHHHHHHHQPHHFFQDQKGLSIRGRQAGWCSTRWSLLPRRDNSIVGKVPFEFYSYASSCEFFVPFLITLFAFLWSLRLAYYLQSMLCVNFWNFDFVVNIVDNLG